MPRIAIISHVPSIGVPELQHVAAALQVQATQHLAASPPLGWGVSAEVVGVDVPLMTDWVMALFTDADQPGALGYHDKTSAGQPLMKVFPLLDPNTPWSVTASHEMLETLVDPECCAAMQCEGEFYALEIADAVEQDQYSVGSTDGNEVFVSNFVLPPWFTGAGSKFDFLGNCREALEIRSGGYAQKFSPGVGWIQMQSNAMRAYRKLVHGRGDRRARRS